MKNAGQIIAELEEAAAIQAGLEAEQDARSAEKLAWMFAELSDVNVMEKFGGPSPSS
jgi:hypothetical protein